MRRRPGLTAAHVGGPLRLLVLRPEPGTAAGGFHAACLQHEIDPFDGIAWIARPSRLRRERAVECFAKVSSAIS